MDEVLEFVDQSLLLVFLKSNDLTKALSIAGISHRSVPGRLFVSICKLAVNIGESLNNLLSLTALKPLI